MQLQPYLRLAGCLYPLRNFLQYPFTTAAVSQSLGMALLGQKSYTVINSEDNCRRANDYFPRTPFLFLINYPKQIYKVLRNFHCTAQYPLNQTPPTGWTWGKLRLKKPTQSDVSPVIILQVGEKIVFIAHYHSEIEILEVCGLIPHRRARGLIKPLKIKESCGWIEYLLIMLTVACYMVTDMYSWTICSGWKEDQIYRFSKWKLRHCYESYEADHAVHVSSTKITSANTKWCHYRL